MASPNIDKLFTQAVQLRGAEQLEFLAALAPDVRSEIESLLAADAPESTGRAIPKDRDPQLANTMTCDEPAEPEPVFIQHKASDTMPLSIGPYKILQPIGIGGMGQVFMAEQTEPVRRRVALKVIRSDTPTKEILARFKAERQALAMMDHQNIAKVLDAGITEDGRGLRQGSGLVFGVEPE